jgi:hypothetical protein
VKQLVFLLLFGCLSAGWAQDPAAEKKRVQEVLRQTVAEKEREAARRAALTNQTFRSDPHFAEMERRYVEGEITARAFRKYLQDYQPVLAPAPLVTNTPALTDALALLRQHDPAKPNVGRPPQPFGEAGPTNAPTATEPPAVDFEDLETKMNKLMELKRQRDENKELTIEHLDLLSPASGLARRERLDLLLKLYIEGVITEPEYQAHREKLLAEPLPKPPDK